MLLVRRPWRGLYVQLYIPEALFYFACSTQYLSSLGIETRAPPDPVRVDCLSRLYILLLYIHLCSRFRDVGFRYLVPYWQLSLFKCACAPPTKKNYLRYARPPSLRPARRACQPQKRWAVLALRMGPKAATQAGPFKSQSQDPAVTRFLGPGFWDPGSRLLASRSRAQRGPSSCIKDI